MPPRNRNEFLFQTPPFSSLFWQRVLNLAYHYNTKKKRRQSIFFKQTINSPAGTFAAAVRFSQRPAVGWMWLHCCRWHFVWLTVASLCQGHRPSHPPLRCKTHRSLCTRTPSRSIRSSKWRARYSISPIVRRSREYSDLRRFKIANTTIYNSAEPCQSAYCVHTAPRVRRTCSECNFV